eukprot:5187736-Amphidinium_carterae.1
MPASCNSDLEAISGFPKLQLARQTIASGPQLMFAGASSKAPAKAGKSVTVAADGACSGNPGPGGWAVVLQIENGQREHHEFSGFEADTTNNRMELQAAIQAVRLCTERGLGPVKLLVDSQYVAKGITEWIHSWKAKGWRTASKKPVKNMDLWQELDR